MEAQIIEKCVLARASKKNHRTHEKQTDGQA